MKKILLLSLLLCGCATRKYVTVTADYKSTTQGNEKYPQVVASENCMEKIQNYKRVVVCLPQNAASPQKLVEANLLIHDAEKVWTSEIEKQFMTRGFTVLSLQKYNELLRDQVMTSQEAATALNADFIVSVNSLVYSSADRLKQQFDINLTCYSSPVRSDLGTEKDLRTFFSENRINLLKEAFATGIASGMLSAYLDVSVIDVKTGELLFIYKNKVYSLNHDNEKQKILTFLQTSDPINGKFLRVVGDETPESSAFSGTYSVETENQTFQAEVIETMVEKACADFIQRLINP